MIDRRTFLLAAPLLAAACATRAEGAGRAGAELRALCKSLGRGNRLGVAMIDTRSGRRIEYEAHGRFAMASTFKVPLAAAIFAEVEAGRMSLADPVAFSEADLTPYSPVLRANLAAGRLPLERLLAAIVEVSDNGAANLLLRRIGGPAGLTAFFRRHGDTVSRLDRWEEDLGTNLPGDPRDTTSPAAMAALFERLLVRNAVSPASRARIIGWMEASPTGRNRLRSGFPPGWRAGDKTGTGARGAVNDVAIAWPPGHAPVIVAAYLDAPGLSEERHLAVHGEVGRIAGRAFG